MYKAFGIVNSSGRNIYVDGMQDYRPIGAFSFLGRYRVIDFPISNMTNSNIDRIQVYINNKPRSVVEHVGTGRHYNINSKSGRLQLLFSEHNNDNDIYNTDISCYLENMESLSRMSHPYVVIAPSYMVYSIDFDQFIHTHIDSRKPRPGEEDGREYFFRTRDEFEKLIEEDALLEYAQYVENYYGTPRSYVEEQLQAGRNVILEIEIQGAMKIKKKIPEALLVFVTPPTCLLYTSDAADE